MWTVQRQEVVKVWLFGQKAKKAKYDTTIACAITQFSGRGNSWGLQKTTETTRELQKKCTEKKSKNRYGTAQRTEDDKRRLSEHRCCRKAYLHNNEMHWVPPLQTRKKRSPFFLFLFWFFLIFLWYGFDLHPLEILLSFIPAAFVVLGEAT